MQIISEEQKAIMNFAVPATKGKSQLRKDVETIEVGQSALFKNSGNDYKSYQQLYNTVNTVRKTTGRTFELRQLADKSGAVVTRTA